MDSPLTAGDIMSRLDLLRVLGRSFETPPDAAPADTVIHAEVLAEFDRQSWGPSGIAVRVNDGIVDLDGVILCAEDRIAIRVATQNIPGVKSVRNHLIWVEPNSGMTVGPAE